MKNWEDYHKIAYYFEEQFDDLNHYYYQCIIHQLTLHNKEVATLSQNLYGDSEQKFNSIFMQILESDQDVIFLYQQMNHFQYNHAITIFWCINDICNVSYEGSEQYLIELYEKSPIIYRIQKQGDSFLIDCIFGQIKFQKAHKYFEQVGQSFLSDVAQSKRFADYCHNGTFFTVSCLKDSFACTLLCPQAFVGQFYHSITLYHGCYIDLNYNCVIPKQDYIKLTKANIIQTIAHNNLEEKTRPFKDLESRLYYSALDTQAHDIELRRKLQLDI